MAAINIEDLLEIEQPQYQSSIIRTTKTELYSHNVFFDDDIENPPKYRDLINLLYTSGENSEFNFFINTSGGSLTAALAIVEAVRSTDAMVRAIITGECHSAGSIITLNCHEIIVTQSAHMLIHTASYSTGGNTSNIKSHVDFSSTHIEKILDATYSGFLSESELKSVKQGTEFWFNADEIGNRLESRLKHNNEKNSITTPIEKKPTKRSSKTE